MELITNILAIAAVVVIVGGAVLYIVLAKKRGEKCVGCPYAKQCGGKCHSGYANSQVKDPEKKD